MRFFLLSVILIFLLPCALAQQTPHNVQGRVFNDNALGNGAHNGVAVLINETVLNLQVFTRTNAPPLPQFLGSYSASITGIDGNLIIAAAWNTTHFGMANTSLLSTTTSLDIHLNFTRGSEANVSILLPLNNSILNTTDSFNVTANITFFVKNAIGCEATLVFSDHSIANVTLDQSSTISLGDIMVANPLASNFTVVTWNVSGIKEGKVNASISVRCQSDVVQLESSKESHGLTIRDTTTPFVSLLSPQNNSWIQSNVTFIYNVTENTGLFNCSLLVDGLLNQTSDGVLPGIITNFTLNDTPEGGHTWMVSCVDNGSSTLQGNSTFRSFIADHTPPNITLLFPLNNSPMENYTIMFHYNVSDNFNATNCSLAVNEIARWTNHTIFLNSSNNFTYTLPGGNYNWSVNCSDNAQNTGASGFFSLFSADLKIAPSDIVRNKANPASNEIVEINATVHNLGPANHTLNATVIFFEHDLFFETSIALLNYSVNITSQGNANLSLNYTTRVGSYAIVVKVDTPLFQNGSVIESLESNNIANITIPIPPYHTFYGDVLPGIILDTFSNKTVFQWLNSSSIGNIYAADTDSSITFTSLMPLGRNASMNITSDDFSELDLALNTTNLTDSINRTYTFDGWANTTLNFTLFSRFVTDVPVANSTNSSNFVTGILWDSSDSLNGNYSGAEDVVFLTRMNQDMQGRYGVYDYELRIPANLEGYSTLDLQDSISFYRELQ